MGYLIDKNFTHHVITVNDGQDVAWSIIEFCLRKDRAVFVLSAVGSLSTITVSDLDSSRSISTFQGHFDIISFSGSFIPVDNGELVSRLGGITILSQGPDGRVFGGTLAGSLMADGPVRLEMGTFLPGYCRHEKVLQEKRSNQGNLKRTKPSKGDGIGLGLASCIVSPMMEGGSGGKIYLDFQSPGNKEQQMKIVHQEASEGDNDGQREEDLMSGSSFANFHEMGYALSLVIKQRIGKAYRGQAAGSVSGSVGEGVGSLGTNNVKQGLLVDEDQAAARSIPCTSFIPESNVYTSLASFFNSENNGKLWGQAADSVSHGNQGQDRSCNVGSNVNQGRVSSSVSFSLFNTGGGSDANQGHAIVPVSFSPSNRARSDDSPSQKSDSSDGSPSRYLDLSSFHGEL
ncbi:hypothetical protein Dimus_028300 [Dionaea muscipula]